MTDDNDFNDILAREFLRDIKQRQKRKEQAEREWEIASIAQYKLRVSGTDLEVEK